MYKAWFNQPKDNIYRYTIIWSNNFGSSVVSLWINNNGTISAHSDNTNDQASMIWNSQINASDQIAYFAASTSCNKNAGEIDVDSINANVFNGTENINVTQKTKDFVNTTLYRNFSLQGTRWTGEDGAVNNAWTKDITVTDNGTTQPYYQVSYMCGGDNTNAVNMINGAINGNVGDGNYNYITFLPCTDSVSKCIFKAKLDDDGFLRLKKSDETDIYCQIPNNYTIPNECNPTNESFPLPTFPIGGSFTELNGGYHLSDGGLGLYSDNGRFALKITNKLLCLYYIDLWCQLY
jgi:hypothetical protein